MERVNNLSEQIQASLEDADKFFNQGNKAAGVRLRKKMMLVKNLAGDIRKDVTDKNKQG